MINFVYWAFKNKSTVSPACRKRRLKGGWRQDLHSGRQLLFIAKLPTSANKKLLRGSTSDAAARRRAARRMKTLRQSRKDPQRPTVGGNHGAGVGRVRCSGAEASLPGQRSSRFNLRRSCRVASWNVLSLRDDDHLPLLSRELGRLGIGVAALSEVRRPKSGEISVGGYTYYWSGRLDGYHTEGVAVAVSDRLTQMVVEAVPINERIMRLRVKHSLGVISVVSVYAPTEVSSPSDKDTFYAQLESVLDGCPRGDTLLVMGDFNASTGADRRGYEACIGPHGSGNRGQNGTRLLDLATGRGLRVAGSWFQRPERHRWTWYSNTGGVAKEIDHVLVDSRWRVLQNCRVFRSAQFLNTDHRLLVATLRLRLKSRRMAPSMPRLDVSRLRDEVVANDFAHELGVRLGGLPARGDPGEMWNFFRDTTLSVARERLGVRRRARKGFVSEDTLRLIDKSREARLGGSLEARKLRRLALRSLRADKEAHVRSVCGRIEGHLQTGDSGAAYEGIRALRSSKSVSGVSSVRSASGELLTEESEVRARWASYFEQLYRADPQATSLEIADPLLVADPPIDCEPPTLLETRDAVSRLKSGKAAGACGIHAEFLKAGGGGAVEALHVILSSVWTSGEIPSDWKRGIIVPLWKGKGNRQDCNAYRGVTLLSVPSKVLARILLNRIRPHLLKHQRPEQSGFTPKRSTIDRILALRVLSERMREFRCRFFAAYIDLRKAFDSVDRDALWRLLRFRGVPQTLINLLFKLYSGTESAVRCGSSISEFFPVSTGVGQGRVEAPTLFNTCMDWGMGRMVEASGCGVSFGDVKITDLDFADDAVIFAETLELLVGALETLGSELEPLGLKVSWIKTKIQVFGGSLEDALQSVPVCGGNVELVDRFTYLGSDVHFSAGCLQEVNRRIGKACGVMDSLDRSVWRSRYLSKRTKIRVFRSLVLPVLLYGCETWTLTGDLRSRLNVFGTRSLRRILGYRWSDCVSNERLLRVNQMRPVTCVIRERQMRLYGHVARFSVDDPARRILSAGEPSGWTRPRGRPYDTWLRQVDRYFAEMGMGRVAAWRMAVRRPGEYRSKVSAATRCCGACSH